MISQVVDAVAKLVPEGYVDPNDPNVIAERELLSAANAIEAASRKLIMLQMAERPREANQDLNFEEQIIEAAKAITTATGALMRSATGVQREIIANGKNLPKEVTMYFSDGTWSDGLVSAAKAVVGSTQDLCNAANQFVKSSVPIEKVIVCAKGVSASTVQLLTAAYVRSDPNSIVQLRLRAAAKAVTDATDGLVLASKSTRDDKEVQELVESSSSHKKKIIEMEIQMKILSLEKELEESRAQLAKIRKNRYDSKIGEKSGSSKSGPSVERKNFLNKNNMDREGSSTTKAINELSFSNPRLSINPMRKNRADEGLDLFATPTSPGKEPKLTPKKEFSPADRKSVV